METVIFTICCLIIFVLLVGLTILDLENKSLHEENQKLKKELSETLDSDR